jgi:glycosyltransferase involved in cell wall biosynthesis
MIDLIIPYYNNPEGLARTLNSINSEVFKVTIVDDCSTNCPLCPIEAQVFLLNKNGGPGNARQFGIDHTTNDFIMFIDAGDIFLSQEIQWKILEEVERHPQSNLFSWLYYYKEHLTQHTDNRLHGKVYRRAFLKEYGITFCPESSYMNEDIGFNRTCKLIIEQKHLLQIRVDIPIIHWIEDRESLTQKDDQAALYRDQTRALSLVSIHTIETCNKNNINAQEEINQIAMALYYWFIRTAAERIEFLPQAWAGAKIFYTKYKKEIKPNKLISGNGFLKRCLIYRRKINFPINVLRFAHEILIEENLPSYYLT